MKKSQKKIVDKKIFTYKPKYEKRIVGWEREPPYSLHDHGGEKPIYKIKINEREIQQFEKLINDEIIKGWARVGEPDVNSMVWTQKMIRC